jgi:hypothetical protein
MYNYNPLPNQQWQSMVYNGIYITLDILSILME